MKLVKILFGLTLFSLLFSFKTIEDNSPKKEVSANGSANVPLCFENIYSVDNFLLKEKIGEKPSPTTNPSFTGGLEELKKHFSANPLTDELANGRMFRVVISFIVNCEGKAGNFEVISKGRGELETLANQVLAVVRGMPQSWEPATDFGRPIDCYQVLTFTVSDGKLDMVSYK